MYNAHPKTGPTPSGVKRSLLGLSEGLLLLRSLHFGRPKESLEETWSAQPKQNRKATQLITPSHSPSRTHHHGDTPRPCYAVCPTPSFSAARAHTDWRLQTRHALSASRASSPREPPGVNPRPPCGFRPGADYFLQQ